jgi:hypothetical protein
MTDVSDLDSFVDHPLVGHFIKFEKKKSLAEVRPATA